jgi:hypothetical protein
LIVSGRGTLGLENHRPEPLHGSDAAFCLFATSQEESSDAVSLYNIGDDMVLVDTAGLFGYKEKVGEESQVSQISKTEVELRKSG